MVKKNSDKNPQKNPKFNFDSYNIDHKSLALAHSNHFTKGLSDISGRPSTNLIQIIKRFTKNTYAMIALVVFLIILLTAIIVPIVSPYGELDAISSGKTSIVSFLPPFWFKDGNISRMISGRDDSFLFDLINEKIIDGDNLDRYIYVGPSGDMTVTFNPWKYLNSLDNTNHQSILGTDAIGRDIWTRLWIGTRQSLILGLLVASVEAIIGISIGAYIGFHAGGKIDIFAMRIIDVIRSVPSLIWFIVLMFILPPGFWSMFLALVIVGWTLPVTRTRVFIIKVKDLEYIKAAESIGVSKMGLIFRHALPNIIGKLLVGIVLRIPIVIFAEASLAFLGISASSQIASLGNLINDAKGYIEYWWYILAPTIVLLLITISMQIMANGLHDAFDPRTVK